MKRRTFLNLAVGLAAIAAIPSVLLKPKVFSVPLKPKKQNTYYIDLGKDSGGEGTADNPYGADVLSEKTSNSNLGIGTTTPTTKLDVVTSGDVISIKGCRHYPDGFSLT